MKSLKTILCLLLCLLLGLSCAACGESPAETKTETPAETQTESPAETQTETQTETTAPDEFTDENELPMVPASAEEEKPLAEPAGAEEEKPPVESESAEEEKPPVEPEGEDEDELPILLEGEENELPILLEGEEPTTLHHVQITVRDYGTVTLELDAAAAPLTVQNFLELAQSGFYDGLTFHRIMDGFMVQGGDPLGNGTGGSDKKIPGEFAANGWDNPISHKKGVISMARAKDVNSASSQFFICVADSEFLDGQYAAFGHVTEGMELLEQIAKDARPIDNNGTIPAAQQPVIERITVLD